MRRESRLPRRARVSRHNPLLRSAASEAKPSVFVPTGPKVRPRGLGGRVKTRPSRSGRPPHRKSFGVGVGGAGRCNRRKRCWRFRRDASATAWGSSKSIMVLVLGKGGRASCAPMILFRAGRRSRPRFAETGPVAYPTQSALPNLFALCSHARMMHISPESVSAAIRSAPVFARLGLSMRDASYRERAVEALAVAIVERLEHPRPAHDGNQMTLPL